MSEQETSLSHALMLLASALVNIVLYMFSKSTGWRSKVCSIDADYEKQEEATIVFQVNWIHGDVIYFKI